MPEATESFSSLSFLSIVGRIAQYEGQLDAVRDADIAKDIATNINNLTAQLPPDLAASGTLRLLIDGALRKAAAKVEELRTRQTAKELIAAGLLDPVADQLAVADWENWNTQEREAFLRIDPAQHYKMATDVDDQGRVTQSESVGGQRLRDATAGVFSYPHRHRPEVDKAMRRRARVAEQGELSDKDHEALATLSKDDVKIAAGVAMQDATSEKERTEIKAEATEIQKDIEHCKRLKQYKNHLRRKHSCHSSEEAHAEQHEEQAVDGQIDAVDKELDKKMERLAKRMAKKRAAADSSNERGEAREGDYSGKDEDMTSIGQFAAPRVVIANQAVQAEGLGVNM